MTRDHQNEVEYSDAVLALVEAARKVVDASFGEIDEIEALAAALARFDEEDQ